MNPLTELESRKIQTGLELKLISLEDAVQEMEKHPLDDLDTYPEDISLLNETARIIEEYQQESSRGGLWNSFERRIGSLKLSVNNAVVARLDRLVNDYEETKAHLDLEFSFMSSDQNEKAWVYLSTIDETYTLLSANALFSQATAKNSLVVTMIAALKKKDSIKSLRRQCEERQREITALELAGAEYISLDPTQEFIRGRRPSARLNKLSQEFHHLEGYFYSIHDKVNYSAALDINADMERLRNAPQEYLPVMQRLAESIKKNTRLLERVSVFEQDVEGLEFYEVLGYLKSHNMESLLEARGIPHVEEIASGRTSLHIERLSRQYNELSEPLREKTARIDAALLRCLEHYTRNIDSMVSSIIKPEKPLEEKHQLMIIRGQVNDTLAGYGKLYVSTVQYQLLEGVRERIEELLSLVKYNQEIQSSVEQLELIKEQGEGFNGNVKEAFQRKEREFSESSLFPYSREDERLNAYRLGILEAIKRGYRLVNEIDEKKRENERERTSLSVIPPHISQSETHKQYAELSGIGKGICSALAERRAQDCLTYDNLRAIRQQIKV